MSRTHHPRGAYRFRPKRDIKADAHVERRCAEAVGLRRLAEDLPTEQRHAGDPWRWT